MTTKLLCLIQIGRWRLFLPRALRHRYQQFARLSAAFDSERYLLSRRHPGDGI
jgi:hypothetical protein